MSHYHSRVSRLFRSVPVVCLFAPFIIFLYCILIVHSPKLTQESTFDETAPLIIERLFSTTQAIAQAATPQEEPSSQRQDVRFAIIGDYGLEGKEALGVSNLVNSWEPDFVTTVGDNNYPNGSMASFDDNVGQYYHQYIHNYLGEYGEGSPHQRFFPTLGNHDWESMYCAGAMCHGPYFDYFSIDSADRYYTFQQGPVRFFMMDSDSKEPDGISGISTQALWLKEQLAASNASWNLVLMHHPPYSSGGHRSHDLLQWNFAQWGADAVISGHNHIYERIERDNMLFFVNGLGGKSRHILYKDPPDWVKFRYNRGDGAMLVDATPEVITFQFYDRFGTLHDSHTLTTPAGNNTELHSASSPKKVSVRIAHATHDAVEHLKSGVVQPVGYVLDLGETRDNDRTIVGLRFADVAIPANAQILHASIEFTNQRSSTGEASFTITGEKSCNAKPFEALTHSLFARKKTAQSAQWSIEESWELVGETNRTEELAAIVQEIVNYRGWKPGSAMAFYLYGPGDRNAVTYELQPAMAAQLHIEYEAAPPEEAAVPGFPIDDSPATTLIPTPELPPNGIFIPMIVNHVPCEVD